MAKEPKKERCFVLMPFEQDFNDMYEDSIKPTVEDSPVSWECLRADEIYGTKPFIDDINEQINDARVVIADLTGRNPNVMYELGLAHKADKPVILLTQSMDDVPSDLKHIRCIVYRYTPRGALEMKAALRETLLAVKRRRGKLEDLIVAPSEPAAQPSEEPESNGNAGKLYTAMVQRFGFGYRHHLVTCTIDLDGNATFSREIELEAHSDVEEVNFYLILPEKPRNAGDTLDFIRLNCMTPGYNLIPEPEEFPNQLSLRVVITPPLPAGETLKFAAVERTAEPLYATRKGKGRMMSWDYFAWDISRPTRRLEMIVVFPAGFRPDRPGYDVWYSVGRSMSRNTTEYTRVRSFLEQSTMGATATLKLAVAHPVLGLTYVIRWEPPD